MRAIRSIAVTEQQLNKGVLIPWGRCVGVLTGAGEYGKLTVVIEFDIPDPPEKKDEPEAVVGAAKSPQAQPNPTTR